MVQTAKVRRIIDEKSAEVEVERISACGENCASCKSPCGEKRLMTIIAQRDMPVQVGDTVVVESRTSQILSIAAVVYVVPLIFFFAGYFVGAWLGLTESGLILVSMLAFAAGFLVSVPVNRSVKKKSSIVFKIISVNN